MPEALKRLQQQAMEIWRAMDASQKTRMLIIAGLVVACVSLGIFMITRPSYENLFSGRLDEKETGEISKILKDNKIDYKVIDGGTGLQVRNKDIEQTKLLLSQSGYPKGGMTFKDALGSIKLSTTESDKKKIFKEYTEQKIVRGLKTIDNVTNATVLLSIPEKEVYLGEAKQQEPTASVVIETSEPMSKKQIRGIENFVAGSVEGLNKKNVMILDKNTGNMLSENQEDDLAAATTQQYEFQAALKKEIETKVQGLLGEMYDGVRVAANVVCDFNTETTKEVKYAPVVGEDSGILRSTETYKEDLSQGASGGVPGTDSNSGNSTTTPSYQSSSSGSGAYKKATTVNNFEINQKNTESEKAVGQMDKEKSSITVSLIYGTKKTAAPAQADIDTYTKMISNATGIAAANITLASFKIPTAQAEKPKFDWLGMLTKAVPVLILAVLIIFLGIGVMKQTGVSEPEFAFGGSLPKNISAPMIEEEPLEEIELEEKSEVKKQIDKFVKHKPEAVAQLLRNWLADEWD
ncbi:MAG: flagellar basal-body MS-ring/collar protein FliF [Deltaproteobacteria bacterium]